MRIEFDSTKLRKVFDKRTALVQTYGDQITKKIMARMAVLKNSPALSDVPTAPPDRCHQLHQNKDEQFAVDLVHPHRLIFEVAEDPISRKVDGGIHLAGVTAIRILGVIDYHGR